MSKVSPLVDSLIEAFQCLPGVGPKSAQRMVLHLLERNKNAGLLLASTLGQALENVDKCSNCRIFTEASICQICSNEKRNKRQICVVESVSDVFAIEQSNQFNGHYFILHGHLSPIDDIGPEELALEKLFSKIKGEEIEEIILATNPTSEGQLTAQYIADQFDKTNILVTRLAQGLPMGSELDYIDDGTLLASFKSRRKID